MLDGAILKLPDGTVVRNVEHVAYGAGGDAVVTLKGDFAAHTLDLSCTGWFSYDDPEYSSAVKINGDVLSASISVAYTLGFDSRELTVASGLFRGFFTGINSVGIVGSSFDDTFVFEEATSSAKAIFDGGDGIDVLKLNAYSLFNDSPRTGTFVFNPDGSIESSFGAFAGFEQFEITYVQGTVVTGELDDRILGAGTLSGGAGNDVITAEDDGYDVRSVIDGGAGDDVLTGMGLDTLSYASAAAGVAVDLTLAVQNTGGAGVDETDGFVNVIGSSFSDVLLGDDRDTLITDGGGDDTLDGRGGTNTLSYAPATAGVNVRLALTGPQNTVGAGVDTIVNFANLTGSAFNDVLGGTAGDNRLNGGAGDDRASYADALVGVSVDLRLVAPQDTGWGRDTLIGIEGLVGSAFDDRLTGNDQSNQITGGLGNDVLDGSTGFDVADYADASIGVSVSLGIGGSQNPVGAGTDTLLNFEGLSGSAFDDALGGDKGDNRLIGGAGDDRLTGGFGSDDLAGGTGEDTAVYDTGSWSSYAVDRSEAGYVVTALAKPATDTLSGIEFIEFAGVRYAIADTVNVGPRAVADALVVSGSGHGNVLANDRDANLADPRLGETLTVTGAIAGRGAVNAFEGSTTLDGRFGTLTLSSDGHFSYDVDADAAGRTGRDVFRYEVTDAHGASSTTTLTLTLDGSGAATIDPWGL